MKLQFTKWRIEEIPEPERPTNKTRRRNPQTDRGKSIIHNEKSVRFIQLEPRRNGGTFNSTNKEKNSGIGFREMSFSFAPESRRWHKTAAECSFPAKTKAEVVRYKNSTTSYSLVLWQSVLLKSKSALGMGISLVFAFKPIEFYLFRHSCPIRFVFCKK